MLDLRDIVLRLPPARPAGVVIELVHRAVERDGYRSATEVPVALRVRLPNREGAVLKGMYLVGCLFFGVGTTFSTVLCARGEYSPLVPVLYVCFLSLFAYVTVAAFVNRLEVVVERDGVMRVRTAPVPVGRTSTVQCGALDDVLVEARWPKRLWVVGLRRGVLLNLLEAFPDTPETRWFAEALRLWFGKQGHSS